MGDAQGLRDDHPLRLRVRGGDAFEGLEAGHGLLSALGLTRKHAADGLGEDHARGAVMEGAPLGVGVRSLLEIGLEVLAVPVPRAGNVDLLAAHDDHFLAVEKLLRDYRGETPEQMALAVHYYRSLEHFEGLRGRRLRRGRGRGGADGVSDVFQGLRGASVWRSMGMGFRAGGILAVNLGRVRVTYLVSRSELTAGD